MSEEKKLNPLRKKVDAERIRAIVVVFVATLGISLSVYHFNASYSNVKKWVTAKKKEINANASKFRKNPLAPKDISEIK